MFWKIASLMPLTLLGLAGARAVSGAELLRDVNDRAEPTDSRVLHFSPLGSRAVFAALDERHGNELWITDGTESGTKLLADIWPGTGSSDPFSLIVVGSQIFFTADDETNFRELWATDGSRAGTRIVANITPNHLDSRTNPVALYLTMSSLDGQLYFLRRNLQSQRELWRSDGTAQGTVRILELPVSSAGFIGDLRTFGNRLYFSLHTTQSGDELWTSDGTAAGTVQVADQRPGAGSSSPEGWVTVGSGAYFTADDGVRGREFWFLPSPGASPVAVPDLIPGSDGLNSIVVAVDGNRLIVAPGEGRTPVGITCVENGVPTQVSTDGSRPVVANGRTYFFVEGDSSLELWDTDCTVGGTELVSSFSPFSRIGSEYHAGAVGSGIAISIDTRDESPSRLFVSDGTAAGTAEITLMGPRRPEMPVGAFISGAEFAFFVSSEFLHPDLPDVSLQHGLWRTDGTPAGTVQIASGFRPTNGVFAGAVHNGLLYLPVDHPTYGEELFISNGMPGHFSLLRDIAVGSSTAASTPSPGTVIDGTYYFSALDAESRRHIWRTDGTDAGTIRVDLGDVQLGGIDDGRLTVVGRRIVYAGIDEATGFEPWAFDLDTGVNTLLADLDPGQPSGMHGTCERNLPVVGGRAFFNGFDGDRTGIFFTDGTPVGTGALFPAGSPSASLQICRWARLGDYLIFHDGQESLWRTDGTAAGTMPVHEATFELNAEQFVESNGLVYFTAANPAPDPGLPPAKQLWRSDGTGPGTFPLGVLPGTPRNLTPFGSLLAFRTDCPAASDCRLYVTDGTIAGTRRVSSQLTRGPRMRDPLPVWRGRIYMQGVVPSPNSEAVGVYSSDGNAVIAEFPLPENPSLQFMPLLVFADRLVGVSAPALNQHDLWASDGTAQGTAPLASFPGAPGVPFSSVDTSVIVSLFGQSLIFRADDGWHGQEPWIFQVDRPSANYDNFSIPGTGTSSLDVLANDSALDTQIDGASIEIMSAPRNGSATVDTSTGTIGYTPAGNTAGLDQLTYRVSDTLGNESNVALVDILVLRPEGPPPAGTPPAPPPPPPPPPPQGGGGGGGPVAPWTLLAIAGLCAMRKRR